MGDCVVRRCETECEGVQGFFPIAFRARYDKECPTVAMICDHFRELCENPTFAPCGICLPSAGLRCFVRQQRLNLNSEIANRLGEPATIDAERPENTANGCESPKLRRTLPGPVISTATESVQRLGIVRASPQILYPSLQAETARQPVAGTT